LVAMYNFTSGKWNGAQSWNTANCITALSQYAHVTNTTTLKNVVGNTLSRIPSFISDLYADEGWWALAWVEAYRAFNDIRYLHTAETIFNDMITGWDSTCSGGVWVNKTHSVKNAEVNELFLSAASQLYLLTNNTEYLIWAMREWDWFFASGLINNNNLINEALDPKTCTNTGATPILTSNQGTILTGLVALHTITKSDEYLTLANAIAKKAISSLVNKDGILRESCEPDKCGTIGAQLKGPFARNFGRLYQSTKDASYASFITANAASVWDNDRNEENFGLLWGGPFDQAEPARQSSAQDMLNAAILQ